jgi:hypothetical protein
MLIGLGESGVSERPPRGDGLTVSGVFGDINTRDDS